MGGVRVPVDALKGEPPENISYVVSGYHIIYDITQRTEGQGAEVVSK